MCAENSYLFSVPSVEKAPEKYDDRVGELNDFYRNIAVEQLREDDTLRAQGLEQLRDWIAKHPHIQKCRTDAPFLLRFLRGKKYLINTATETLERYLVARVMYPQWFTKLDIEEPQLAGLVDTGYLFPLPERDSQGRALVFNETGQLDPSKFTASDVARIHMMVNESFFDTNEVQCAGLVLVYDLSGMTMGQLSLVTLNEIRVLASFMNKAFPLRIQEIHFVNTPGATLQIANFALALLSEKLRERVFCHKNWDECYTKVDKNLLPKEFGGKIPKADMIDAFKKRCQKMRGRMLLVDEMDIEVTKDSKYWQENSDIELESGAVGSFRQLTVD
ncbi:retinaldehyde-binding protein 1-like [Ochlerotatus camptorhynchus]|uniref:retinaldehyde-binding protein 1-like n=1 Tax=Ochlerotatus camptorhynchus TaxID=644619 RepID=UPI0031D9B416